MNDASTALQNLENRLLVKLKLRQLRLLVTVEEEGSILRAAAVLNVAQPAATKMIRDIEATLGVELFNRSNRGVTPTMYGEVVIRHAKVILSQIRYASEELASMTLGASGRIVVGTLIAAAPKLLPQAILALKRERPAIDVSIVEGTNDKLFPQLRIGDLDMVIGLLPEWREHGDLSHELLDQEPVSIVVREGHPLTRLPEVSLADLQDQEWIFPPMQTTLRGQLEQHFRDDGLDLPHHTIESVSVMANLEILRKTDLVAAMPGQVADAQMGVVQLPLVNAIGYGPMGVTVRSKAELSSAARYFLATLRQVAGARFADSGA